MKTVPIGIDPGNRESAICVYDGECIFYCEKVPNSDLFRVLKEHCDEFTLHRNTPVRVFMETIQSYGMGVGDDVFETCFFIGRMQQRMEDNSIPFEMVKRTDIKMHYCKTTRAKDANITTALVDRFDPRREFGAYGKGTAKNKGFFYGMSKDMWSAFAIALYGHDNLNGRCG